MKDYPVGATWEAKNERGRIIIWLDEKKPYLNVWRWQFYYAGGSSPAGFDGEDWEPSYQLCRKECGYRLHINGKIPRFKRVK